MVSNIYLLLGVPENAPWPEVCRAYSRLMESLNSDDSSFESELRNRMEEARARLSITYEYSKQPEVRQCLEQSNLEMGNTTVSTAYCRPKIGQMLVASGLLTLQELDAVLEIQRNTKTEHIPLGELMVAAGYITQAQLDYYLRMQKLFKLPSDHPERWGQRLIELGLVTEDQLKVALIEQQTTGCTLREALICRGYLTPEMLDRIF
jgi:hypothetical protein